MTMFNAKGYISAAYPKAELFGRKAVLCMVGSQQYSFGDLKLQSDTKC